MRSQLFSPQNAEAQTQHPGMTLQNSKMLKIALHGEMLVRQGSMVAYQGNVHFEALGSGGVGKFLKQQFTGEGVPLMKCSGAWATCSSPTSPPTSTSSISRRAPRCVDDQRQERAGVRPDPALRHPPGAGRRHIVQRGPVQLRVPGTGPHRDHDPGHPGRAQRRPADLRRPAGGGRLVLGCRPVFTVTTARPRHAHGPHHRRSVTLSFTGRGFVIVQPSEELPGSVVGGTGGGQQAGQSGGGILADPRRHPGPLNRPQKTDAQPVRDMRTELGARKSLDQRLLY